MFTVRAKVNAGSLLFPVQFDALGAVGASDVGRHLEIALRFSGLIELRRCVLIVLGLRVGTQPEEIFNRFFMAVHGGVGQRGFALVVASLNHGSNVRMNLFLTLSLFRFVLLLCWRFILFWWDQRSQSHLLRRDCQEECLNYIWPTIHCSEVQWDVAIGTLEANVRALGHHQFTMLV